MLCGDRVRSNLVILNKDCMKVPKNASQVSSSQIGLFFTVATHVGPLNAHWPNLSVVD